MRVLIANDDGIDCPLFLSLLRVAKRTSWIKDLSAVVPAFEKSWVGSAVTRDQVLYSEEKTVDGVRVNIIDGTPADCISIALTCLDAPTPDLVVSGLNVGSNAGVVFSHSSGTINAAKFAALHGVRAVAFSTLVDKEVKDAWNQRDFDVLNKFASVFDDINAYLLKATKALFDTGYFTGENALAHYCSFNTPMYFDASLPPVLSTLKNNRFQAIFERVGENSFGHKYKGSLDEYKEVLNYKPTLPFDLDILKEGRAVFSLFRVDYDYGNLNLPSDSSHRISKAWS